MKYKNILPSAQDLMRFRIFDGPEDVLKGDIAKDNAIFMGLEETMDDRGCHSGRAITDLAVNECLYGRFRASGTTGTYKILRVL